MKKIIPVELKHLAPARNVPEVKPGEGVRTVSVGNLLEQSKQKALAEGAQKKLPAGVLQAILNIGRNRTETSA